MPKPHHHSITVILKEGLYWVARLWFRGLFYHRTLRGRRPKSIILVPEENWPGSSETGTHLVKGKFRFLHHSVDAASAFTGLKDVGRDWQCSLNSFDWLRDMRAVGTDVARIQARGYLINWITANQKWHTISWQPDILSSRLCNWLTYAEFISLGSDENFAKTFLETIGRQAKHLRRVAPLVPDGLNRMIVLKAQIYVALCLPGHAVHLPALLKRASSMCEKQILLDGGHIERNPEAQIIALRHLIDIKDILEIAHFDVPEALQAAIDRAAPMLRFYRHGDGGFALFNGSTEGESWLTDVVLAKSESGGKPPNSASQSGFERIVANRTLFIFDTGTPSALATNAHAGSLSFEMSVGKQRMIVNCGGYTGRDEAWRLAQRSTAAHSTLIVENKNSSEILATGLASGPLAEVICKRKEADGNTWLEISHDGYKNSHGLIHQRRIYVNASGTDVRGEDTLKGEGEHKFSIRFHLHPLVKASLVKDGASVLLRLPDKSGWRVRCSGGVASLQESVYLGDGLGSRRSEQIVISGATRKGDAQVKWAVTRLNHQYTM